MESDRASLTRLQNELRHLHIVLGSLFQLKGVVLLTAIKPMMKSLTFVVGIIFPNLSKYISESIRLDII